PLAPVVALLWTPPATADDLQSCFSAHEQAQRLRRVGKLAETRAQLEACTRTPCPEPVRQDCTTWLDDLAAAQPTLVVVARDPGSSTPRTTVRVPADGVRVAERLTGHASDADPGEHRVRLEAPDGRVVEQKIFVSEGEKARRVELTLPAPPPPPEPP